ncbi:sodium:solute symporter family transporter [Ereboglobus luteus]|nr:sodium/solute symporter [Ereboglobus luteus]
MNTLDYIILVVYFLMVCGVAAVFAGKQKSLKDYFLGDRNVPWYAAMFSGIATIVSATSFIGGPAVAFTGNLQFLQYRLALPIVLGIICGLILPTFFRQQIYSIYEYLERRFDVRVRLVASVLFLLLKSIYLAICIYAPALVLARMTGLPVIGIVLAVGVVTALYTMAGGIKAVIWTDTLQLGIFIGAIGFVLYLVCSRVEGGAPAVWQIAGEHGHLDFFNFSTSLKEPYTFLGGLLGGTVYTLSQFGVDQAEVQRYLTTKNIRQSNLAMITSMLAATVVGFALFFIGAALFAFYQAYPQKLGEGVGPNDIFPKFIIEELPHGIKGVLIAAILAAAMSTVSAVLNSMATVTLSDIWPRVSQHKPGVRAGRICTLAFGAMATVFACFGNHFGNILELSLMIGNLFGGSLVGTFLLGMLTRRVTARAALVAMICGFASALWLAFFTDVARMWYGFFSMLVVFAVGFAVSLLGPKSSTRAPAKN